VAQLPYSPGAGSRARAVSIAAVREHVPAVGGEVIDLRQYASDRAHAAKRAVNESDYAPLLRMMRAFRQSRALDRKRRRRFANRFLNPT
jgi:hypothetical protein